MAATLNKSDTPRTDAVNNECFDLSVHGHILRMTAFARTLERELQTSEARRIGAIESLKEHIDIARAAIREGSDK